MTIVELLVALVVLLVAVGGTLGSIGSFVVLGDSARETAAAYQAAQNAIEDLRTQSFTELFARYNTSAADDPGGVSPGAGFAVPALQVQANDPDGFQGEILFPIDPAFPTELREDIDPSEFRSPLDLDGDGATDALDHSADYQILPVIVRVAWRSEAGNRVVEISTVLRNGSVR